MLSQCYLSAVPASVAELKRHRCGREGMMVMAVVGGGRRQEAVRWRQQAGRG